MSHTTSSVQKEMTHGNRKDRFCQLIDFLPRYDFQQCVQRYRGNYKIKTFSCWINSYAWPCPTDLPGKPSRYRSLSPIHPAQALSHGFSRKGLTQYARSCQRGSRLADLCRLCSNPHCSGTSPLCQRFFRRGVEANGLCPGLTTIDLCLSLFPWAKFRKHKAAVKLHTLLDLHGNIPSVIFMTHGKIHDVKILTN